MEGSACKPLSLFVWQLLISAADDGPKFGGSVPIYSRKPLVFTSRHSSALKGYKLLLQTTSKETLNDYMADTSFYQRETLI